MTYSLTEQEEILYERQIDELFNLTEVTPLGGDKETYTDPATGQTYEVDPATAWRLKKADATAHYTDQYPSWDEHPTAIPQQPIEPIVKKQEQEPTVSDDGPILIPPIVRTKPKVPKIIPTKPKPKPPKVIPLKHARPKIVNPLKTTLPIARLPVTTLPKAKLPIRQLPVRQLSAPLLPSAPEVKKLNLTPLSPRNKIAQGVAQERIDDIMVKLNNPKTSLKQGKNLLTQLTKLEQLKMLQLKIPKAQIPPRFSLPAPTGSKLATSKLGVPDSKLATPRLDVPKSPTVPVSKLGVPDPKREQN